MSNTGKLIIVRHAVPFHPRIEAAWTEQVEHLAQRLEPHLPDDRERVITLTSPKDRAVVVAQHLFDHHGIRLRRLSELSIGDSTPIPPERVLEVVTAERRRLELVIVISHEPVCERLAVDVWRSMGMRMITPPNFKEYTSAVMIDPAETPDFAWEWTYL